MGIFFSSDEMRRGVTKMKILLSSIVLTALVIAGIGGTLAGFSDSEESFDNYIVSGSIDLKVNGEDDQPWGEGVPAVVTLVRIMPSKTYEVDITVRNDGEAYEPDGETPEPAYLYIHLKDYWCDNIEPVHGGIDVTDYPELVLKNKNITSPLKPEPEMVAEFGGRVGQVEFEGLGQMGDECCLTTHVELTIAYDDEDVWGPEFIGLAQCKQLLLGTLPPCGEEHTITLKFHLPQQLDYAWQSHGIEEKFKYWPTNAFMVDALNFGILFELLQEEYQPDLVIPTQEP
jgi:predicted ribosomally synthesized peptide with SipW-like signal peptide